MDLAAVASRHLGDEGQSEPTASGGRVAGSRGVGLALVAQVARRHGGEVEVGSSALGGAEFTVTLPGG